jgi:hypothetical protein
VIAPPRITSQSETTVEGKDLAGDVVVGLEEEADGAGLPEKNRSLQADAFLKRITE